MKTVMLPPAQPRQRPQVGERGSGPGLHEERARKTVARAMSSMISQKKLTDAEPVTVSWEVFSRPMQILDIKGPSGHVYRGTSCCLRPGTHPRRCTIYLVETRWFDALILGTILANCFTMMLESPLDPPDTQRAALIEQMETLFMLIFTAELLLKVVAYGLVWHRGSYLRDPWCQLDVIVVILAWAPLFFPDLGNYSGIRTLRALRPLRALKWVPGMPALVSSILAVLPKFGPVLLLLFGILLISAITCVGFFKGLLHYRCATDGFDASLPARPKPGLATLLNSSDPDCASHSGCVSHPFGLPSQRDFDTSVACDPSGGLAGRCHQIQQCSYFSSNPVDGAISLDEVGGALMVFLRAITFDDWTAPMYALRESAAYPSVFPTLLFVLVIIFGGFFIATLFLALTFNEYLKASLLDKIERDLDQFREHSDADISSSATESSTSSPLLVGGERSDDGGPHATEKSFLKGPPPGGSTNAHGKQPLEAKLTSATKSPLAVFVTSPRLNGFIRGVVLVNIALMCMPYEGMSPSYAASLRAATTVITWVFMLEMALKLLALGWKGYWADRWNGIDGPIVLFSLLEMSTESYLNRLFGEHSALENISFLRILRLLRLVRRLGFEPTRPRPCTPDPSLLWQGWDLNPRCHNPANLIRPSCEKGGVQTNAATTLQT